MAKLSTYASATPAAGDKLAGVDVSASATRVFLVSALAAYAAAANCQIGLAADRPAAGTDGRLYYATDTETLSRDNGSTWDDLTTGGGGGGAVDSVNGQTGAVTLTAADVGAQPLDSDLTAIAALSTTSYGRSLLEAANAGALRTLAGLGTAATADTGTTGGQVLTRTGADGLYQPLDSDLTAIAALATTVLGRSLLTAATGGDIQSAAGTVIGLDVQAYSDILGALAALTNAAGKGIEFLGSGNAGTFDLTAAGKALLDDADAAAQRTTLGLGTAATADTGTTGGQVLTRTGADGLYQPLDSDLTAIAALSTTSYGRSLLEAANAGALRTLAGLVIGTDVQAYDAELAAIAGLTSAADRLPYFTGSGTAALATFTAAGRALIDDADATAQRATLGAAPSDAGYVTTAASSGLSAETAIPGLAGSADRAAVAGAGTSREFESGDTAPTWTPSSPATSNVGSTYPSHLYIRSTDTTERFALYAWSPAGDFDARCKISVGYDQQITSPSTFGLVITDSGNSNRLLVGIYYADTSPRGFFVNAYTYASSTYTQRGNNLAIPSTCYIRIKRVSSTITFYYSLDGITWSLIASQSFSITVANIGFRLGSANYEAAVDWLRTDV